MGDDFVPVLTQSSSHKGLLLHSIVGDSEGGFGIGFATWEGDKSAWWKEGRWHKDKMGFKGQAWDRLLVPSRQQWWATRYHVSADDDLIVKKKLKCSTVSIHSVAFNNGKALSQWGAWELDTRPKWPHGFLCGLYCQIFSEFSQIFFPHQFHFIEKHQLQHYFKIHNI